MNGGYVCLGGRGLGVWLEVRVDDWRERERERG